MDVEKRIWAKDQEIAALKLQNKHLLTKVDQIERAMAGNDPRESAHAIKTAVIQGLHQTLSQMIQAELSPMVKALQNEEVVLRLGNIEKQVAQFMSQFQNVLLTMSEKLAQVTTQIPHTVQKTVSVNLDKGLGQIHDTIKGLYSQASRAEASVERMLGRVGDLDKRVEEINRQSSEKTYSTMNAFFDRIERQIEIRMKSLGEIESVRAKQNETLVDLESIRQTATSLLRVMEESRSDLGRVERQIQELSVRSVDLEVQTRTHDQILKDVFVQMQSHRNDFKSLKAEIKSNLSSTEDLAGWVRQELETVQSTARVEDLINMKDQEIQSMESALKESREQQNQQDLIQILAMLKSQRVGLEQVAQDSKNFIQDIVQKNSQAVAPQEGDNSQA